MNINFAAISNVVGVVLITVGALMLTGIPFSIYYDSNDIGALLQSALITMGVGGLSLWWKFATGRSVGKREGYLIVAICWLSMVSFGSLPYLLSGTVDGVTDAFFETISGMTTTGASIMEDIEALPAGILYWRSLSQWIGGMGIIVLTVAIFPLLGIGGVELFGAEAPGPTADKIHPKIRDTAKALWQIYVGLTILLMFILWAVGMTFYDAINHALTTMATGGFSTKNASMMAYDLPQFQYPIIIFMILAGTNYTVIYLALTRKWKDVWRNEELKLYVTLIALLTLVITTVVFFVTDLGIEKAFRDSIFQVASLITTTGFVSADYTQWHPAITMLLLGVIFTGACAGSTSGGIKIIRHLTFFKNMKREFQRLLHPRAILPLKINGEIVPQPVINNITIFLLFYLGLFAVGCIVVSILGLDFTTAIGAVATSISNVGPGVGKVGPVDNFAWLSDSVKWVLMFLMLLGRLELFTILILFTPYFWRGN
ncbi:MAG: TrkH family potassium uptake protein [Saprospiraceae bacterium]